MTQGRVPDTALQGVSEAAHAKSVRMEAALRHDVHSALAAAIVALEFEFLVMDRWCSGSDAVRQPRGIKHSRLKEQQMTDDTNNELTPEQMAA